MDMHCQMRPALGVRAEISPVVGAGQERFEWCSFGALKIGAVTMRSGLELRLEQRRVQVLEQAQQEVVEKVLGRVLVGFHCCYHKHLCSQRRLYCRGPVIRLRVQSSHQLELFLPGRTSEA